MRDLQQETDRHTCARKVIAAENEVSYSYADVFQNIWGRTFELVARSNTNQLIIVPLNINAHT